MISSTKHAHMSMRGKRAHITESALHAAQVHGAENLTRALVCGEADIPEGSFTYIMGESFSSFILRVFECLPTKGKPPQRKRMYKGFRGNLILSAAVKLSKVGGLTRKGVADTLGVSPSLVSRYYKNKNALKAAVAEQVRND